MVRGARLGGQHRDLDARAADDVQPVVVQGEVADDRVVEALGAALVVPDVVPASARDADAAVSPPSTTLALVDHPQRAGTASSVLGLARFAAGGLAAPLVGLGGGHSMTALAVVASIACAGAVGVFLRLVRRRP